MPKQKPGQGRGIMVGVLGDKKTGKIIRAEARFPGSEGRDIIYIDPDHPSNRDYL
jgi:hypothetical protein